VDGLCCHAALARVSSVRLFAKGRRASLRLRLTLSYGGVFLLTGLLLVASNYMIIRYQLTHNAGRLRGEIVERLNVPPAVLEQTLKDPQGHTETVRDLLVRVQDRVIGDALQRLLGLSAGMLLMTGLVSLAAGWFISGRMLRPVHEVTAAARRLSASTLDERIDLPGPNDELKELADTFDEMLTRLASSFRAQQEFVANASHELRTPLAIMRTEIDVTLDDADAGIADYRQMAETLREATGRSEAIIDRLLVLARCQDLAVRKSVDLSEVVEDTVAQHREQAAVRGLTFNVSLVPAPVAGDPVLLNLLVANLVDNAVRYAPAGNEVRLSTSTMGEWVEMKVANDGEPIAAHEVARLFERFYRPDSSRSRATGGSGLGLAIVAAIARAHGGDVAAEALAQGGLVVTVRLPKEVGAIGAPASA